jgi:hypothetical protein
MTPQEMHIQIDQALQRIGSYVYDNFEEKEIDLILSKVQLRALDDKFRRDNMSEGFEYEQGDLDDVQVLIERDKNLPAFLDLENNKVHCVLPSDYYYLINDRTKINDDCDVTNLEMNKTYVDEQMIVLPFKDTTKVSAPYYETLTIDIVVTRVFDYTEYSGFTGIPDVIEKYILKQAIIDKVNQDIRENKISNVVGIYWERFRDIYRKESFIIIVNSNRLGETGVINIDGNTYNDTTTQTDGLIVSTLTHLRKADNRLTKSQFLHSTLNNNIYHKTNRRNPVSNLTKDRLYVYYDEKYIPTGIIIDYIRKPQEISLSLNQSCELSESLHPKIIDLAVEYMKNTIEQQSYNIKVQDNQLRSE